MEGSGENVLEMPAEKIFEVKKRVPQFLTSRLHQTQEIRSNTAVFVVTFCGNSRPDICKLLVDKMERAKGFEPSTLTLAT